MFSKTITIVSLLQVSSLAFHMESSLSQIKSDTALSTSVNVDQCCCSTMPCLFNCNDPCEDEEEEEEDEELPTTEDKVHNLLSSMAPLLKSVVLQEKDVLLDKQETDEILDDIFEVIMEDVVDE